MEEREEEDVEQMERQLTSFEEPTEEEDDVEVWKEICDRWKEMSEKVDKTR